MKTKTFDCVEMKRQGAVRIHEQTKDMTLEEKIDYWRRRSQVFQNEPRRKVKDEKADQS
jgi:hypothetical protein